MEIPAQLSTRNCNSKSIQCRFKNGDCRTCYVNRAQELAIIQHPPLVPWTRQSLLSLMTWTLCAWSTRPRVMPCETGRVVIPRSRISLSGRSRKFSELWPSRLFKSVPTDRHGYCSIICNWCRAVPERLMAWRWPWQSLNLNCITSSMTRHWFNQVDSMFDLCRKRWIVLLACTFKSMRWLIEEILTSNKQDPGIYWLNTNLMSSINPITSVCIAEVK